MRNLLLATLAGMTLAACSGSSTTNDAGPVDAGVDAGAVDAGYDPSCSHPGTMGNAQGVGMFCTPHGDECGQNPQAIICTAAFDHTTNLWFCTRTCQCDSDCGENAICAGDNNAPPLGCVPVACAGGEAGNPVCPYPDGGYPDAGAGDGG